MIVFVFTAEAYIDGQVCAHEYHADKPDWQKLYEGKGQQSTFIKLITTIDICPPITVRFVELLSEIRGSSVTLVVVFF